MTATGARGAPPPEQLRGLPVDGRSDIFTFGLLLHEMATGTHPFLKSSPISTIDAILNWRNGGQMVEAVRRMSDEELEQALLAFVAKERQAVPS